jgi:hypothetical protein
MIACLKGVFEMRNFLKVCAVLVGLALPATAAYAGTNQVTAFMGLGDTGNATISPGSGDGFGTINLLTGSNPDSSGSVSFVLSTVQLNMPEPCVFSFGVPENVSTEVVEFWPFLAQVGQFTGVQFNGGATLYWRTMEALHPNAEYTLKFSCRVQQATISSPKK